MSSIETQTQILAQLLMLTNQMGKLQEEVVELRGQLDREPVRFDNVKETTSTVNSGSSESTKSKKVKKVKKIRPEGYVKKPATTFMMWMNECFRPKYKEEHPGESAATATAAGLVWKSMSDEDKSPWLEKYNLAQTAYHMAVDKNESPIKVVNISDELSAAETTQQVEEAHVKATKLKKSGKSKDPHAPKKPSTAWMMWKNEVFGDAFKLSNPGESLAKASGLAWKALSDEEKAPWQTRYREAKAKWDKETRTVTIVSDELQTDDIVGSDCDESQSI